MEYNNYTEFVDGVADAVYQNEIGQHCLLENFNFGVERKHIAELNNDKFYDELFKLD